jgi:phosphatidylserine decarboxylase
MNYITSSFRKYITKGICAKVGNVTDEKVMLMFVRTYEIDISSSERCKKEDTLEQCVKRFKNINDIFTRKRKNIKINSDALLVSPADGLFTFYMGDVPNNIKIKSHKVYRILIGYKNLIKKFSKAMTMIFRLRPEDYHRFHFPIDGIIKKIIPVEGDYFSMGKDVYDVNKRVILIISSKSMEVCMVLVGALCVGSIILTAKMGKRYKKGDEIGYFMLGGSGIVMFVNHVQMIRKVREFKVREFKVREIKVGNKIL